MARFTDKIVVITGAGEGLGRTMALLIAAEGGTIVVAGRRAELLDEPVALVEATGGRALSVPTDVTDEAAVERLVEVTVERFGAVDVLLNNASQPGQDLYIWEQTLENWNATIAADVTGPMLLTREVVRQSMLERRRGSIVNFSSTASVDGMPRKSHYTVAKGGLRLLTKVAARELGPHGIRVNCIVPGGIETDLLKRYWERIAGEQGTTVDAIRAKAEKATWLKKIAAPEETAAAALFLASDDASAITGQSLIVDSGEYSFG
jgi:NAD(P)-dependent dehydrogenase (short-subunit alcohol dehydrogenase family)